MSFQRIPHHTHQSHTPPHTQPAPCNTTTRYKHNNHANTTQYTPPDLPVSLLRGQSNQAKPHPAFPQTTQIGKPVTLPCGQSKQAKPHPAFPQTTQYSPPGKPVSLFGRQSNQAKPHPALPETRPFRHRPQIPPHAFYARHPVSKHRPLPFRHPLHSPHTHSPTFQCTHHYQTLVKPPTSFANPNQQPHHNQTQTLLQPVIFFFLTAGPHLSDGQLHTKQ